VVAPTLAAADSMPFQARPAGVQFFGSPIEATSVIDLTSCLVGPGVAVSVEMLTPALGESPLGLGAGVWPGWLEKSPQPATSKAAADSSPATAGVGVLERFIAVEL